MMTSRMKSTRITPVDVNTPAQLQLPPMRPMPPNPIMSPSLTVYSKVYE